MKCEIQSKVWLTFNIDKEVIVAYNKSCGVDEDLLSNFNTAIALGFNPFQHANWEFSEESVNDIQNNQTGLSWFDTENL